MTFLVDDNSELAELLSKLKTENRDLILIVADYDEHGAAAMRMLATHDDIDQAIDQIIFVAEQETECACGECDDDGQLDLGFEKATLQ